VYSLSPELAVVPAPERAAELPLAELDPAHYRLLDDFEARFPFGPPSMREAELLRVSGDVTFGRDVVVRGRVELDAPAPLRVGDRTVLGELS
ncbi:MAG TPA: UTP--glucose-1-phosphate uridylyltransferase, partial [Solirubrobacteraceae bacterium]|nr:UTP--glucose-1-phosphate uridylyltransferase [Solirubrobacteraceae bacterium]